LIAPGDGCAHRLLALREIAGADRGEQHVAFEPPKQILHGQRLHPWRRELQRKGQRVELLTERFHGFAVLRREAEVGLHVENAFHEQPYSRDVGEIVALPGDGRRAGLQRERPHSEFAFSSYAKWRPTGDDQSERWN